MPYVYMDELGDGQEAADVRSADEYNALQLERDTLIGTRDELQRSYAELEGERDTLAAELDDAKTKFANAFLSSPQQAKQVQEREIREEETPKTFATLFSERNLSNAN